MEPQADAVRNIDEASTKAVELSGELKPGRLAMAFRLVFTPAARFLGVFIIKGSAFKGVEGFKSAVNAWALSFATESKRYEKHYADDTALKSCARDFLS